MSITAECTACGRRYEAPASMAGKRVRCKQCGNIFALPDASFEEGPDLDALAAVEQSFHSVDATDAGGSGVRDSDEGEETGESVAPLRAGRRSIRFSFPLAGELDAWLPTILMLGGLIWLGWFCLTRDSLGVAWLPYVRLATALIAYFVFVAPITQIMITKAGRQLGYQMPTGDKFRSYATYLPAFVLGYVLWIGGGGRLSGLILGCVAGVVLATLFLWFLFRLSPTEIAPSATYALAGFFIGLVIVGAIYFGLNALVVTLIHTYPNLVNTPESPFGPPESLAWISAEKRQELLAERERQSRPAPTPAPGGPVVAPAGDPLPPPEPVLPAIVSGMQTAQVGPFDELIRPLTPSNYRATARRTGESIAVQVWNSESWQRGGNSVFTVSNNRPWENRFALSADGKFLAKIAAFPNDSVQIWDFGNQSVAHFLEQPMRPNQTPEIVGFVAGGQRVMVLWRTPNGSETSIEIRSVSDSQESRTLQLAPMATRGTTLAFNADGTLAAVAAKVDSVPSLLIYNMQSANLLSTTRIDSLNPRFQVQPTGMAFSADGAQVALLFEEENNGLLVFYEVNPSTGETRKLREWVYPAGPIANRGNFQGNTLQWLPDGKSWLLYGRSVFSVASGQRIEDLGVANVEAAWVSGTNLVELISRGPDGQRQYNLLRLNMNRISEMLTR